MKDTFLYYLNYTLVITAISPYNMLKGNTSWYAFFRNVSHVLYCFLLLFIYMEFPYIWNDKEKFIESINLLTTYTVLAVKMYICRKKIFADLICEMVSVEQTITSSEDANILGVYRGYVKRGKYIKLYNLIVYVTAGVVYLIPYVKYLSVAQLDGEERKLPFYMWMPFNKQKYYLLAFAVNVYFLVITIIYYFTVPVLIIVLLLYTSCRLNVLGCLITNLKTHAKKIEDTREDAAIEAIIRSCILEHLKIMKVTNTLNYCLRNVTMLEFIVLSAHIALILFEGFTSQSSSIVVVCIVHVILLLVHMLLFYWHADEIRHESVAISEALYDTDWYEYGSSTSSTIHIMMMRSQKALSLSVGPFGEMSLTTALKILKGVYTYITFLQHSYGHKVDS